MRKLVFSILLASAAASPALAQDNGRWHHEDAKTDRAEAHEQRQQQQQQPARVEVRQEQHRSFEGGRFEDRGNAEAQVQVQQQAAQQQFNGQREQWQGRQATQSQQWQGREAAQSQQWQGRRSGQWQGREGAQSQQWQGRGDTHSQQWQGRGDTQSRQWQDRENAQSQQWQGRNDTERQRSWSQSSQWTHHNGGSSSWNRDWRNDRRYDWRNYREHHRSTFHLGIYYDPFGYGYQQFDIGYRLFPGYFGQQYWIDPQLYQLPYPPPGTQWIRYWNDAVLVDIYSGEVIDVIRDFFW
jgi:Ni/Co efflux regulator RcnB